MAFSSHTDQPIEDDSISAAASTQPYDALMTDSYTIVWDQTHNRVPPYKTWTTDWISNLAEL